VTVERLHLWMSFSILSRLVNSCPDSNFSLRVVYGASWSRSSSKSRTERTLALGLGTLRYQMVVLVTLHGDLLEMELTLSMKEAGGRRVRPKLGETGRAIPGKRATGGWTLADRWEEGRIRLYHRVISPI
jgi:hypothetical protein